MEPSKFSFVFHSQPGSLPTVPRQLRRELTPIPTIQYLVDSNDAVEWFRATAYELVISQSPYGAGNVVFDANQLSGSSTSLQVPAGILQYGSKYAWKCKRQTLLAKRMERATLLYCEWQQRDCTTRADASNAGTSTDTGYSVATLVPTMTWSGQNATQYELSIVYYPYGTSNSAYDTLLSGSAVSQGIPAGVLQNGVKYRWNLQATNATGQSAQVHLYTSRQHRHWI